jgi:signal transduction histidine kinase
VRTIPRPPLTGRPASWLALDGLFGVGYVAIAGAVVLRDSAAHPTGRPVALELAAIAVLGLACAMRRRSPVRVLAVVLVVLVALRWPYPALVPAWSALYLVAGTRRRGISLAALAATIVASLYGAAVLDRGVLLALVSGLVWAVGYAVGRHRAYEREALRHQLQQADAELEKARRGIAEERIRIARELHDVVAHSMSVITVQAGYGQLVIDQDPARAREALGVIGTTGREALTEMRRLLGVLRAEDQDGSAGRAPAPSLADLEQLVRTTARAGVRVQLEITGRRRPLPAGIELSAYRIVQEALTNVVRHAGTPVSHVTIGYEAHQLSVEITDDGADHPVAGGPGHGLIGMQERVNLYGGWLRAGPLPERGFQVLARLPLGEAAT